MTFLHLRIRSVFVFVLSMSFTTQANDSNIAPEIKLNWDNVSSVLINNMPYLPVDKSVKIHDVEQRGFVEVPFDYSKPNGKKLDVFYRFMPSKKASLDTDKKPILVVMNGGPGAPSSGYRALNYNYQTGEGRNSFSELDKYFRILVVDQRGTGYSSPIDLNNSNISATVIAKYFDADEHARDHAEVIKKIIGKNEQFFIMARSYGGHIGFQYLALDSQAPKPDGFILVSAIQPGMDGEVVFSKRREKQLALNQYLLKDRPGIDKKLNQLRGHLQSLKIDRNLINALWGKLGKGEDWSHQFETMIDELNEIKDAELLTNRLSEGVFSTVNLLNYILSSSALTPGFTDKTLTISTSKSVPFLPWMLDENWTLNQIGNDGSWRQEFVQNIDQNPPPASSFPAIEEYKSIIKRNNVLFTFGVNDAFLEPDHQLKSAKRFNVDGQVTYKVLNGGHGAAFSKEGAVFVNDWAKKALLK